MLLCIGNQLFPVTLEHLLSAPGLHHLADALFEVLRNGAPSLGHFFHGVEILPPHLLKVRAQLIVGRQRDIVPVDRRLFHQGAGPALQAGEEGFFLLGNQSQPPHVDMLREELLGVVLPLLRVDTQQLGRQADVTALAAAVDIDQDTVLRSVPGQGSGIQLNAFARQTFQQPLLVEFAHSYSPF